MGARLASQDYPYRRLQEPKAADMTSGSAVSNATKRNRYVKDARARDEHVMGMLPVSRGPSNVVAVRVRPARNLLPLQLLVLKSVLAYLMTSKSTAASSFSGSARYHNYLVLLTPISSGSDCCSKRHIMNLLYAMPQSLWVLCMKDSRPAPKPTLA